MRLAISCAAHKSLLAILRRFVSNLAEELGFSDEDLLKIEMAVDEACTNALVHAAPAEPDDESAGIDMTIMIEPQALTFQIRDSGAASRPLPYKGVEDLDQYADPDREGYRGLGILIMKEFMDEVEFTAIPATGTMVTMKKNRKVAAPE
jgi:serine/threonine-protein kinase RsbW